MYGLVCSKCGGSYVAYDGFRHLNELCPLCQWTEFAWHVWMVSWDGLFDDWAVYALKLAKLLGWNKEHYLAFSELQDAIYAQYRSGCMDTEMHEFLS